MILYLLVSRIKDYSIRRFKKNRREGQKRGGKKAQSEEKTVKKMRLTWQ